MCELALAEVAIDGAYEIDFDHELLLTHLTQCLSRTPLPALKIGVHHGETGLSFTLGCQPLALLDQCSLGKLIGDVGAAYMIHFLQ